VSANLLVLYDADCGICTHVARLLRRLDRPRRLDLRPLETALELPDAPPLDALRAVLHARDASGRWVTGGAAILRICREVRVLRPIGFLGGLPGVRGLVEPSYRLVARNRHRISRRLGLTACPVEPRR
jgi:predicted DCC family thiol-disulfide oxidoreductase YuxK